MTSPTADGWIAVHSTGGGPTYFVRCRDDGHGGVEITQLLIASEERITAAALRAVPIGRIEAAINGTPLLLAAARRAAEQEDPVLERLEDPAMRSYLDALKAKKGETAEAPDAPRPLQRPNRSDPERFYGEVAERYLALVQRTAKPAVVMAEESGVPVATARRWINEARRRGLLPPGRQGRAQ